MQKPNVRRYNIVYCVIVGDIIKSREIDSDIREKVLRAANDAFDRINTEYISSLMATFGMVRGDAFEGVLFTHYQAPKIVQEIIKAFYLVEKTTVRISVVMGRLTSTGLNRDEADGPAFHKALEDLEKMKERKSDHWLQVSFDTNSLAQPIVESQLRLLTALTEGWTDRQREIAWEMESRSMQQKLVGKALGISSSVVHKQLRAANYDAYHLAWHSLEDYLIAIDEQNVGKQNKPTKNYASYYSVALRKFNQYNYSESLPLFKTSLDLAIKDLGSNDLQLVPIYNKLAETYALSSNICEAEKAIQESMRLQEKLPKARLQYAETLASKARIYCQNRDFAKAREFLEKALEVARNTLNEEHPFIGALSNNLALMYNEFDEPKKALDIYAEALIIAEKGKNDDPVPYAIAKANMASCYYKMENYEQSILFEKEALEIFEENLPPRHKYVQSTQKLLAKYQSALGGNLV